MKKTLAFSNLNKGSLEKVLFKSEWDSTQSDAVQFLIVNMKNSFSYDTSYLNSYRPILLELDSLRHVIDNKQALNIINQKWNMELLTLLGHEVKHKKLIFV